VATISSTSGGSTLPTSYFSFAAKMSSEE
jgi:hypothetical protein